MGKHEIIDMALQLKAEERHEVAERILQSLDKPGAEIDPVWAQEALDTMASDRNLLACERRGVPALLAFASSIALPLVVPVDRAQGFEQRLNEFMQREQVRQKQRAAKPSRRASQKM